MDVDCATPTSRWLSNYDTHAVGGTAVVERMRTQGVLNTGDTIAYAYGISRGEYRGQTTFAHSGSWAGNRTYVVHFPEMHAGVNRPGLIGDPVS